MAALVVYLCPVVPLFFSIFARHFGVEENKISKDARNRRIQALFLRALMICTFLACCLSCFPSFDALFCIFISISHVRKELSHSDWLFVCKLKTNP